MKERKNKNEYGKTYFQLFQSLAPPAAHKVSITNYRLGATSIPFVAG